MDGQMDIFDFIEQPAQQTRLAEPAQPRTMLEHFFTKIKNPLIRCTNCLCHYCTHNVEELYDTVKLEEASEPPCFICDECRAYTGNFTDRVLAKEECSSFTISDYGAKRIRKNLKIIQGGERGQN